MKAVVYPSEINGEVYAPASKSSMQRACAAALGAKGAVTLINPGVSNDDKAALGIIKMLGAQINQISKNEIKITPPDKFPFGLEKELNIHCGESGLSIRMFTPILSLLDGTINISGEGSLISRPMDFFDEVLPSLGVQVQSNHGHLPIRIQGPMNPSSMVIDGALSSQYLTGMLFAYALSGVSGASLSVKDLKSKPYVDLTIDVIRKFGLSAPVNKDYEAFHFSPEQGQKAGPLTYQVEGDWSGGAFLLVAGAIAGDIVVKGLDKASTQADKAILNALDQAGCRFVYTDTEIHIFRSPLRSFEFDATDCPDLFPPLAALAAYSNGISVISGVDRLAHKESNRGLTLQSEFGKMGINISLNGDKMYISGGKVLSGRVNSHHDHRIAMACGTAALRSEGKIEIENAEAINKSYPFFFDHLKTLNSHVEIFD